jgi:hypothetical protein
VHVYVLFTAYEPYFSDTCEWVERVRFQQLVFPAFVKDAARCDLTWWLDTGALVGAAHRHALLPWDKDIDVGMLVPLLKTGEEPWETVENRGRADFHPAYDCWFASDEVSSASYAGRIPGIRRQNSGWFSGRLSFMKGVHNSMGRKLVSRPAQTAVLAAAHHPSAKEHYRSNGWNGSLREGISDRDHSTKFTRQIIFRCSPAVPLAWSGASY